MPKMRCAAELCRHSPCDDGAWMQADCCVHTLAAAAADERKLWTHSIAEARSVDGCASDKSVLQEEGVRKRRRRNCT